jgi:hypothetical protein
MDGKGEQKMKPHLNKLDDFTIGYIEAALWSSTDDNDEPLDSNYAYGDIDDESVAKMIEECKQFQEQNAALIERGQDSTEYTRWARAGHDFWLTRNRHGAGFWDGDWPKDVGKALTEASHQCGESSLYAYKGKVFLY